MNTSTRLFGQFDGAAAAQTSANPLQQRGERAAGMYDVLVAGSGLVGSIFVLAAAQAGLSVAWVAGAPAGETPWHLEPWDRRVYALSLATRRLLDNLRIWPQLDSGGQDSRIAPIYDMRVFGASGAAVPLGGVPGSEAAALHFGAWQAGHAALAWIVEHRTLDKALRAALDFQYGVQRFDTEVLALHQSDDAVEVETSQGRLQAKLLVAADGARSSLRGMLGIAATRKPYGQVGVVANFACEKPHGGTAHQWFCEEGIVALLPMPGDVVSLVWSAPDALAQQLLQLPGEELARRIEVYALARLGRLTPLGGASGFPLALVTTERQIAPRAALVGDAAHQVHPLAGHGLNLGVQDVEELVKVLHTREWFRDCGDAVLLRRYERARQEPVFAMRTVTDTLQRLFASDDRLLQALRTTGMNLVDHVPIIKKQLIHRAMG